MELEPQKTDLEIAREKRGNEDTLISIDLAKKLLEMVNENKDILFVGLEETEESNKKLAELSELFLEEIEKTDLSINTQMNSLLVVMIEIILKKIMGYANNKVDATRSCIEQEAINFTDESGNKVPTHAPYRLWKQKYEELKKRNA